jgi:hypothetical protein
MQRPTSLIIAASIALAPTAHAQVPPPPVYAQQPQQPPPPPVDPLAALFAALFSIFGGGLPIVPDGMGGWVPFTNSRVMPDGTLRPYDPAIDGLPPGFGPSPMPQYNRPALPHASGRSAGAPDVPNQDLRQSDCYDPDWHFNGWGKPECKGPEVHN